MSEEVNDIWEDIVKAVYCTVCDYYEDQTNGECPKMNHSMRACPARRASDKMRRKIRM